MTLVTRSTPLIFIDADGEHKYPVYFSDVQKAHPNVLFPEKVDSAALEEFGYRVVNETDRPEGDVVSEKEPVEINGEWYRQWNVREYSDDEQDTNLQNNKELQLSRIASFQNQQFAKGFPYEFEGTVYHIQTRISDRSNIDSLHTMAGKMKDAGREDAMFEFRTWENISINLTPQQMIDLADMAFVQVSAAYKRVWAFKDQVNDAKSVEEFPKDYETLFDTN